MRVISVGALSAVLALAGPDGAAPAPRATTSPSPALSIGSPNGGRLDGGSRLSETAYLRVVPYYAESNARWGLPSLVGLLDRAARRVARRFPDAVLSVGDLSRKGGGGLDRHHSHESGRDADVGFYIRNGTQKQVLPDRFVAFSAAGHAPSLPGAVFDDARNWALVESWLDDPVVRLSHIFVAAHIRARLLRYAEQMGVPRAMRERAAEVMMQPRRAAHDDHFHVRVACPPEQRTCVEEAIVYSPRARPSVASPRHRSGTDERTTRPLPPLLLSPKGAGSVAKAGSSLDGLSYPETVDTAARTSETSDLLRPLANGADTDNVDR